MDADSFRREAHRVVDWLADYLEQPERYPVLSTVAPGDIARQLPDRAPEHGESFDRIFADFEQVIVPGLTHWNHPGFFAYFAISASGPGILAEMLAAGLNVQAMLWRTSPAATELEEVTLGWLRDLMGLPRSFEGVIYDTASISTMHALAAAREAAVPDVRTLGLAASVARHAADLLHRAHALVDRQGCAGAGARATIRSAACRWTSDLPCAPPISRSRSPPIARAAISRWRWWPQSARHHPRASILSRDIAPVCQREGVWLHVDAAYAGVMAILPAWRHILDGADAADSLVVNPHKWLFTPFDLSALFCRRMDVLRAAFSLVPEYLRTPEPGAVRNLMDTGVQLGRRFRALKLWMVLRYFGAEGIRERLEEHIRLARLFASWVDASPIFERAADVPFSVVCFRCRPVGVTDDDAIDRFNASLMDAVNQSGEIFLSHTKLRGRFVIRLAVGNLRTTERHVQRAWDLLQEHAGRLVAPGSSIPSSNGPRP